MSDTSKYNSLHQRITRRDNLPRNFQTEEFQEKFQGRAMNVGKGEYQAALQSGDAYYAALRADGFAEIRCSATGRPVTQEGGAVRPMTSEEIEQNNQKLAELDLNVVSREATPAEYQAYVDKSRHEHYAAQAQIQEKGEPEIEINHALDDYER